LPEQPTRADWIFADHQATCRQFRPVQNIQATKQPEGGIFAERRVEHTTNHLFSEKAKMGGVGLAGKGWNGAGGLGVRLQYDNQNEIVNLWAYLTMLI